MNLAPTHLKRKPSANYRSAAQADLYTLTIPTELLTSHRDSALAIGLFCLIVRLYIIHQVAVPLSAVDITLYDPTLTRGAIKRAIQRLVNGGWLVQARAGNKASYRPGWGLIRGVVRLWDFNQPQLNRPRHLHTTPFDKRILDLYLGRLKPHSRLASEIARYSSSQLLTLRDVGDYLLTKAGYSQGTPALERCGLVHNGLARQVPDEATVLAWISQQTLANETAPTLSNHGLKRLGMEPAEPKQQADSAGQMIVYISPENPQLVGELIGRLAGLEGLNEAPETAVLPAPEADNSSPSPESKKITWSHMDLIHDSTMVVTEKPKRNFSKKRSQPEKLPDTLTAQTLRRLGVRPSVVRELCNESLDYVNEIVSYARSRSDVRSVAAWTVATLRDARDHGWQPPADDGGREGFDLEKYTTGKYAECFAEAPTPAVEEETTLLKDRAEPEVVMGWIKGELRRKFNRESSLIVSRMQLIDGGELPVVGCASQEDLAAVVGKLDSSIIELFRAFGWTNPPLFIVTDGEGAGASAAEDRG